LFVRLSFIPAVAGILALAAPLAGCGDVAPSPSSPTSGPIKPLYGGVKIVPIGTEQVTGPYTVTLTSDGAPANGLVKFTAHVTQKDKPLDKGFVTLSLTPPGAKPEEDAKGMDKTAPGEYHTTLSTDAAGEWLAKATVVGVPGTAPAYFSFTTQ
jgi:hypothetical protein